MMLQPTSASPQTPDPGALGVASTASQRTASARAQAVQMRAMHGSLAADILDIELKSDAPPARRRNVAKVLRQVRRLDRQDHAGARRVAISTRDMYVLGVAAVGVVAAAYLLIRG